MSCSRDLIYRDISDTTLRIVDNSLQRLVIIRICHKAEIGYDVLYLLTLIEAESTINTIWYSGMQQLVLKETALSVRTIQYRHIGISHLLTKMQASDIVAHNAYLLTVRICNVELHLVAFQILTIYILRNLTLVVGNKTIGSLHYILRTSVVSFKLEQLRSLIYISEIQNIVNIGSTESIDALSIVAYDADLSRIACKERDNGLLGIVGVLILIHKNITEPFGILDADVLVFRKEEVRIVEHVVEVDGIGHAAT